ncbi:MFS transporter [Tsukamurella soli]|uniref:MFS transporter n=1 Tax=Tsukamurella soli TaxID=644556 RepID=A0ABP8JV33_9ACTN
MTTVGLAVFVVTTTEMEPMGLLPSIAHDLGVSEGRVGLSVTLYGIVAGLLAPVVTVVTGRVDRRTLLVSILVVSAAGNALSAVAQNFVTFMVSRFVSGLIHGLLWAIVASVAVRLVPRRNAVRATAEVFSGISAALVLGVPVGAFIGSVVGWRWVFALLSSVCALVLVLVVALLPALPSAGAFEFSDLRPLVRSSVVRGVLLITATVVVGNYAAYTYVAPLLLERGIGAGLVGCFLLCYGVSGLVGNLAAGVLLSRSRSMRPVLIGLTTTLTAALLLIGVAHSSSSLAVLLAVWGLSYAALPVALQTMVLRATENGSGEATTSIYVLVFNCSIAAGASVGGVAVGAVGPSAAVSTGVLFCAIGVVAVGCSRGPEVRLSAAVRLDREVGER